MAAAPVSAGTSKAGRGTLGERPAAAAAMGASEFAWEDEAIDVGVSGATESGSAPVGIGVSALVVAAMNGSVVGTCRDWRECKASIRVTQSPGEVSGYMVK